MKKKYVLLAAFAAAMLTPSVVWAQYPQITDEAKENYKKMMTEERKRSDEAWAKALPTARIAPGCSCAAFFIAATARVVPASLAAAATSGSAM